MALTIFARACRPGIFIEDHFAGFGDPADSPTAGLRLRLNGGSIHLAEAWDKYFRPAFGELAVELLPMLEELVREYHRLEVAIGQADDHRDRLLSVRSHIESHVEYGGPSEPGHLITWLCEVVAFLAK